MLAAALARVTKALGDLAVAMDATALQSGLLDQAGEALICLAPFGKRLGSPGVIATGMDLHHLAKPPHGMPFFFALDEGVAYRGSLAKYALQEIPSGGAAAFLRYRACFGSAFSHWISMDWLC